MEVCWSLENEDRSNNVGLPNFISLFCYVSAFSVIGKFISVVGVVIEKRVSVESKLNEVWQCGLEFGKEDRNKGKGGCHTLPSFLF